VLNLLSAFSLFFHGFERVVVVLEMVVFIYFFLSFYFNKIFPWIVMMVLVLVLVVEISSLLFCFFTCDDGSCCVMAVCVTY
jgi:hypothetical protein